MARNIQSDEQQETIIKITLPLYSAKLSFRTEGQIKSFTDKKKLKDFITTKPVVYEMLKGIYSVRRGRKIRKR